MQADFLLIGVGLCIIWLIALSVLVWIIFNRYNKITDTLSDKSAIAFLNALLKDQERDRKHIESLISQVAKLESGTKLHIQKIGLIRFNPFRDTGGDQSFIVALMDAHHTGIVISGLYSRSGTRWYAKRVDKGKGVEHELSDEEKKAIEAAK